MSVEAVVTTGIYCRPGCPARPNPGNVRRFGSAAAAEANGFRACLRCRPYRDDPVVDTAGASEHVRRAVRLVLAGALDTAGEADLAARVGVATQRLRDEFVARLGVTPRRLARSRRAHFARRLLDDTDLGAAEIAVAAGYGSVRQFERAMVQTFRAPPGALRARRRAGDRLPAVDGLRLRLPFTPPFDHAAALAYLRARAIRGVEQVAGDAYRRTVRVGGEPGVVEVVAGGPDHLVLRVDLRGRRGLAHVVARVRRIFGLDVDPRPADAVLRADPIVGPPTRLRPGLRPPGAWDPFEVGVRAIVGQQVSVAGAGTIAARLVERYGAPLPDRPADGLGALFPEPATLAGASMSGIGLTATRASAVRAFAEAVDNGKLPLDGSVALDELVAAVCGIDGLGPWTAHYLAVRLGEPDAFPSGDLGLRRAVARRTGCVVGEAELAARARAWRPWRAHAAAHLWVRG
ncbi:MAG TPA: AlkA N-terminal domain-containing protein [Acidimicrobiia bacterium]|nr:AlkA N-terminal domain-containing protein [Acidimicrobiia bacterium]